MNALLANIQTIVYHVKYAKMAHILHLRDNQNALNATQVFPIQIARDATNAIMDIFLLMVLIASLTLVKQELIFFKIQMDLSNA